MIFSLFFVLRKTWYFRQLWKIKKIWSLLSAFIWKCCFSCSVGQKPFWCSLTLLFSPNFMSPFFLSFSFFLFFFASWNHQSFSWFHIFIFVIHWLIVDIFVFPVCRLILIDWLIFEGERLWLVCLNLVHSKVITMSHLSIIINRVICLASARQNMVARTEGELKHLLNVRTLGIIWSSLLVPEFVDC